MGIVHSATVFTCDHRGCEEYVVESAPVRGAATLGPPSGWVVVNVGDEGVAPFAYCPTHWQMRRRVDEIAAAVENPPPRITVEQR